MSQMPGATSLIGHEAALLDTRAHVKPAFLETHAITSTVKPTWVLSVEKSKYRERNEHRVRAEGAREGHRKHRVRDVQCGRSGGS